MNIAKRINKRKLQRKNRIRAKIFGTAEKPRLSVSRSNKNFYAQLIDDGRGRTLAAVSSGAFKAGKKSKTEIAKTLGAEMAKKAVELKINQAVFDKGSYKYHGRVRAFADGARGAGLKI